MRRIAKKILDGMKNSLQYTISEIEQVALRLQNRYNQILRMPNDPINFVDDLELEILKVSVEQARVDGNRTLEQKLDNIISCAERATQSPSLPDGGILIEKIGFLIHIEELFNHYRNIFNFLDKSQYVLILYNQAQPLEAMLKEMEIPFISILDVKRKGFIFKYLVSNHVMALSNTKRWIIQELGIINIRFMYSLGKSNWNFSGWNCVYDLILCFGPYQVDKLGFCENTKKLQMGYPRYDEFFKGDIDRKKWLKKLGCDPAKKTIVWLPTKGSLSSVRTFSSVIAKLKAEYNIVVKPHPLSLAEDVQDINLLKEQNFSAVVDEFIDNTYLFYIADFIFSDYGGTAFGAIYTDCNLVLLNSPEAEKDELTGVDSADITLRQSIVNVDPEDKEKLSSILADVTIWVKQKQVRRQLRDFYFAPYYGNAAEVVADAFRNLDQILEKRKLDKNLDQLIISNLKFKIENSQQELIQSRQELRNNQQVLSDVRQDLQEIEQEKCGVQSELQKKEQEISDLRTVLSRMPLASNEPTVERTEASIQALNEYYSSTELSEASLLFEKLSKTNAHLLAINLSLKGGRYRRKALSHLIKIIKMDPFSLFSIQSIKIIANGLLSQVKKEGIIKRVNMKLTKEFQKRKNRAFSGRDFLYEKYLPFRDLLNRTVRPYLIPLHRKLRGRLEEQKTGWQNEYCDGYFYQGYERIGINGVKPTVQRLKNYSIHDLLNETQSILDIGSNCGFFAIHVASLVREVDAIDINPYLNKIGEDTARFLGTKNVRFNTADFSSFEAKKRYDAVFSLSNHHTIDGKLNMGFLRYSEKIFNLLKPGGFLFFESHNVWGDGYLGPGDDSDLDKKFEICGQFFEIIKHKMVHSFYPVDIDKLFVVFRRRQVQDPMFKTNFDLITARENYDYTIVNQLSNSLPVSSHHAALF
jgi:SAM-dependent methyltransferase